MPIFLNNGLHILKCTIFELGVNRLLTLLHDWRDDSGDRGGGGGGGGDSESGGGGGGGVGVGWKSAERSAPLFYK